MSYYYVNKNSQSTGEHEVHISGCPYMPFVSNQEYLGNFTDCKAAVEEAKKNHYSNSDGCAHCCAPCHKK